MTLFFDIIKLESESKGNDTLFLNILEDYYYVKTFNRLQKLKYKNINGKSWLLNPLPLFNRKIADIIHIVQYIKLAGRRNYHLYKTFNLISLDISFYPDINLKTVVYNPLLRISNNYINFKFEDIFFVTKQRK